MNKAYLNLTECQSQLDGIEAIDYFFAQQLFSLYQSKALAEQNNELFHLLIALHMFVRQGHTCMPLVQISEQTYWQKITEAALTDPEPEPVEPGKPGFSFSDLAQLKNLCEQVFNQANSPGLVIFEADCLYIRRYYQYEVEVATRVRNLAGVKPVSDAQIGAAKHTFIRLFGKPQTSEASEIGWQQVAVANALNRSLSIICGGPGTGKTYTVARLLAVLQASNLAKVQSAQLNIIMAAPTGKAAQRMKESILAAKQQLRSSGLEEDVLAAIPETASTLHRLLGIRPNTVELKYHQDKPLNCDILLVDEVSMIDLAMMAKLLRGLPDSASLIMLGDANQLPSVETGNVLADLVNQFDGQYDPLAAEMIKKVSGQQVNTRDDAKMSHITFLTKTHRFGGQIGQLANEVIAGQGAESWRRLQQSQISANELTSEQAVNLIEFDALTEFLAHVCRHYFLPVSQADNIESAFVALSAFRVLVANRRGPLGVEQLNAKIESLLAASSRKIRPGQHYHGRPVMVTENCYTTGLFNGDVGIIWADSNQRLAAYFETEQGLIKISLARLPKVETVYTMTIHKTQGSEFSDVALICPEQVTALLSPELIYTGITRAKSKLYVCARQPVWLSALSQHAKRYSGLAQRLS